NISCWMVRLRSVLHSLFSTIINAIRANAVNRVTIAISPITNLFMGKWVLWHLWQEPRCQFGKGLRQAILTLSILFNRKRNLNQSLMSNPFRIPFDSFKHRWKENRRQDGPFVNFALHCEAQILRVFQTVSQWFAQYLLIFARAIQKTILVPL